jgi:hypothetical protein
MLTLQKANNGGYFVTVSSNRRLEYLFAGTLKECLDYMEKNIERITLETNLNNGSE